MKFIKKAAALFFCAALALSVMAVTALADDEAELMALADPQPNTKFVVTLEKIAPVANNDNFTGIDATTTDNILDRDYNNDATDRKGYEVTKNESVTFAIKLAYTGSAFTASDKIDGFQFTYVPGSANDNNGNKGVQISGLRIGGQDVQGMRTGEAVGASGSYANIYAFGSLGSTTGDIAMPTPNADEPTIIGTVTFSFANAKQAEALTPTIKTMLIQVRGNQHPQWIVTPPSSGTISEYPLGDTGDNIYITNGTPSAGYSFPSGSGSDYSGYVDGEASTYPIIVNPYYDITVEHFQANSTTGVAEKITSNNAVYPADITSDEAKAEYIQSTVKYYFDDDNIPANEAATANKLPNEKEIPGYTFKGWMVTENSTSSATWDAYVVNTDSAWAKATSYPKVTNAPASGAGTTAWFTAHYEDNAPKTDAKQWDGKNDASTPADYYTIANRDTALIAAPSGTGVSGVKFIPVNGSGSTTSITDHYVGPITLTPVYTRDVYTVTFDADTTANYALGSQARFGTTFNDTAKTRTDYYTIEDLANGSSAVDFLNIHYNIIDQPLTVDNQNLNKPGYKFVGWVGSGDGYSATQSTDYKWEWDYTTRVNQTKVIRNGGENGTRQMKCIGALTLTAEWELDIYFAKVNYWFGGDDNSLILVAVPNANRISTYTYNCESKNASNVNTNFAMFEIPESAQKGAYMEAALTKSDAAANATAHGGFTITSELFGEGKDYAASTSYHLFAYIADANTTEDKITLNEATQSTENIGEAFPAQIAIVYDGDVDGSTFVSVADFGNVDTLLNDATDSADIFAITTRAGVEARLKADYTTSTDDGDPSEITRAFASIADVKGIYGVMGYNTNPVTP